MKEILVLGIGNLILNDEGIGIHVVKEMINKKILSNQVDCMDGATGGYLLINIMSLYKHVIIVDATLDNSAPGTIKTLNPTYPADFPQMLSAHEFGLKQMIDALYFIEQLPEVHLITISVKNYQQVGMKLSKNVKESIPKVISEVEKIVESIIREDLINSIPEDTKEIVISKIC